MKRHIIHTVLIILFSIFVFSSCSFLPGNASIPEWLIGNWNAYDEGNQHIGVFNITENRIEITSYYPESLIEPYDLLEVVRNSNGWTESKDDSYTLYYSFERYYTFTDNGSSIMLAYTNETEETRISLTQI